MYARLIADVREQVYEEQLTQMFFNPDCESFVAELSESTKNRDLWTMSAAGMTLCCVTFLAVNSLQDAG